VLGQTRCSAIEPDHVGECPFKRTREAEGGKKEESGNNSERTIIVNFKKKTRRYVEVSREGDGTGRKELRRVRVDREKGDVRFIGRPVEGS